MYPSTEGVNSSEDETERNIKVMKVKRGREATVVSKCNIGQVSVASETRKHE